MMPNEAVVALTPVREALVSRARTDAGRLGVEAAADAARLIADARHQAEQILIEARTRGHADAAAVRAVEQVRARRAGRSTVLAAQRAAYEDLVSHVEAELAQRYTGPALRAALLGRVRRVLGEAAVVTDAPGGGVLGRLDGRRVEYTPAALAARAVEALDDTVVGLWAP